MESRKPKPRPMSRMASVMQSSSTSSRFNSWRKGAQRVTLAQMMTSRASLEKGLSRCLALAQMLWPSRRQSTMARAAGTTIMRKRSRIMPKVSSSTTEPHSSRSVSGRITGESMVSNRIMDRHNSTLPPPMTIHIREDTAAGEPSISTRLRV